MVNTQPFQFSEEQTLVYPVQLYEIVINGSDPEVFTPKPRPLLMNLMFLKALKVVKPYLRQVKH
ncbi:MAG: hypothetical protein GWN00_12675 [Aliifodinibius sp.]|nr:hypothetical protein [Fodinibius sp.]NIY25628.1 hypothetical protein [Fodinibius sp.]